jgi:hypothetical protein
MALEFACAKATHDRIEDAQDYYHKWAQALLITIGEWPNVVLAPHSGCSISCPAQTGSRQFATRRRVEPASAAWTISL